ncbi:MAG: hypothetical protein P8Y62_00515, partial [candidate division WOR-3 bacterium]
PILITKLLLQRDVESNEIFCLFKPIARIQKLICIAIDVDNDVVLFMMIVYMGLPVYIGFSFFPWNWGIRDCN